MCLGLKSSLIVPGSVSRTNPINFSFPSLTTQVHICTLTLCTPSAHTALSSLAALSSGLGATETVTWNLNTDSSSTAMPRSPARDSQPEPFGQGSSRGHMLRAGWPAWHCLSLEREALWPVPCAKPQTQACSCGEAQDVFLLTFEVTPSSPTGISVVTMSTLLPVRAILGLFLEMKSVWCTEPPPRDH